MNDKDLKELMRINMEMEDMLHNSIERLLNAGEAADPLQKYKDALANGERVEWKGRLFSQWHECSNTCKWLPGFEYRIVDPYAELKAADAAGKVIQFLGVDGKWTDGNDGKPWLWMCDPSDYRIKPEPELYSGLTLEQWEAVMAGGFLCEFRDSDACDWRIGRLTKMDDSFAQFEMDADERYIECRPLRKAGIIQPTLDSDEFREYWDSLDGDTRILCCSPSGWWTQVYRIKHIKPTNKHNPVTQFIVLPQ